jgi:hypothetical protein
VAGRQAGSTLQTYTSAFTLGSAGTHTVSCYNVDNAGNQETAQTLSIKIDEPQRDHK